MVCPGLPPAARRRSPRSPPSCLPDGESDRAPARPADRRAPPPERQRAPAAPTGRTGGPTSPSGPGAPSAKTTAPTATPGTTSPTTTPAAAPIAGTRTGSPASATASRTSACRLALWNGRDPFLKERLFGLANEEGNHGEDVKEYYFYLDGMPSHSPTCRCCTSTRRSSIPTPGWWTENRRRTPVRAGIRAGRRARRRAGGGPLLRRRRGIRQGRPGRHPLPDHGRTTAVPSRPSCTSCRTPGIATPGPGAIGTGAARAVDARARRRSGRRTGTWAIAGGTSTAGRTSPALLFTENETNRWRLFGVPNAGPYVKDAFHEAVVHGQPDRVNPAGRGSKAAGHYRRRGRARRFDDRAHPADRRAARRSVRPIRRDRRRAAWPRPMRSTRRSSRPDSTTTGGRCSARRMPGCSWTKQFYHYSVELWLDGDPAGPAPPARRLQGRNADWRHVYNLDVLSVPDKWEYPWFAAWDTAFHCIALARLDPEWAKRQFVLLLREWYMHPSGQLPAYEWDFADANPPVHAHAAAARLPDRPRDDRPGRHRLPRGGLPQAAVEFHLVGQPQGPRGPQCVPGRVPGPGQYRRVRPQPAQPARRPAARAGRRHGVDGAVLPGHAGHRAGIVADPAGV